MSTATHAAGDVVTDHVRFLMDERGWDVADVASIVGISPATVQKRLYDGDWYLYEVVAIAFEAGLSPSWIMEEDNI